MKVKDIMSREVHVARPDETLRDVAQKMADYDIGSLPVCDGQKIQGMITDRDIAIRAVAQGKSPDTTKVREVMSEDVKYCFDDQDIADVAQNMGDIQVHRLPVVNHDKRLVGIISLADIANTAGPELAGDAVQGISEPTPQH